MDIKYNSKKIKMLHIFTMSQTSKCLLGVAYKLMIVTTVFCLVTLTANVNE
jgi:hypothetical protein